MSPSVKCTLTMCPRTRERDFDDLGRLDPPVVVVVLADLARLGVLHGTLGGGGSVRGGGEPHPLSSDDRSIPNAATLPGSMRRGHDGQLPASDGEGTACRGG